MYVAAFDPDGRILATGGSGGTSLWDVDSGKLRKRLASNSCYALAFSSHGRVLAGASERDGVALWELSTGSTLRHSIRYTSVVLSLAPLCQDLVRQFGASGSQQGA